MNCKKCGNVLNPTDVICPACGEPVNPPASLSVSTSMAPTPNSATSEAIATPIASTDIAVNPNVVVEDLVNYAPSSVSAVGGVASNEPVATSMANTDIAVNPSVVVENLETSVPSMPNAMGASEIPTAPMPNPNVIMQSPQPTLTQVPAMENPSNVGVPQAPVAAVAPAPEAKPKKKLDVKFIIIVVALVLLIIGLGALIIFKLPVK